MFRIWAQTRRPHILDILFSSFFLGSSQKNQEDEVIIDLAHKLEPETAIFISDKKTTEAEEESHDD